MRNINELIGIIKGINFDEVINDAEVEDLKKWVTKNRNLVYEDMHVKLVALIDDILEDNVVTEQERILLVSYINDLIDKENSNASRIYELNGIIEGIICTMTKLSNNQNVTMDVMAKICRALNCKLDDIVEILPEDEDH